MTDVPMNAQLTPDDAAELLRMDARARQRDSRARRAERAAAEQRLIAEREAERLAVLAAKDERIADLERRLAYTEGRLAETAQDLDDTRIMLGITLDVAEHRRRGMPLETEKIVLQHIQNVVRRYRHATMRIWTCSPAVATERAQGAYKTALARIASLPTGVDPVTLAVDVTALGTPVTATMRNADRNLGIADRSQDDAPNAPISALQQAWIDRLGPSPYDPYEAMVEEIEHRAETGRRWDDDDFEDDDETRFADL